MTYPTSETLGLLICGAPLYTLLPVLLPLHFLLPELPLLPPTVILPTYPLSFAE